MKDEKERREDVAGEGGGRVRRRLRQMGGR